MTDLIQYNGNFVNFVDNEMRAREGQKQSFSSISFLDISASAKIGCLPSEDGNTYVQIVEDKDDIVKVSSENGTLTITTKACSGDVYINNGTVVSGNFSVGSIFMNGVQIQGGQKVETPSVLIWLPRSKPQLRLSLSGASVFGSKCIFSKAKIKISGQAQCGLSADSVDVKVSGQGYTYLSVRGGNFSAKLSGQGEIKANGQYSEIEADVSGQGNIQTEGICLGDYEALVSGMGSIRHLKGAIHGRKRKSMSGMGNINI